MAVLASQFYVNWNALCGKEASSSVIACKRLLDGIDLVKYRIYWFRIFCLYLIYVYIDCNYFAVRVRHCK